MLSLITMLWLAKEHESPNVQVSVTPKKYPSGGIVSKQDEYIIPPNPNFDCKKTIFDFKTNNNE